MAAADTDANHEDLASVTSGARIRRARRLAVKASIGLPICPSGHRAFQAIFRQVRETIAASEVDAGVAMPGESAISV